MGVIHLPFFNETFAAGRGLGSWCNNTPVAVSTASDPKTAIISAPDTIQFRLANLGTAYKLLGETCDHLRGYTDCWAHAQVARGAIDAIVEPLMNPWDIRATQVLIEEAGGKQITRLSEYSGALDSIFGNAELVDRLVDLIGF